MEGCAECADLRVTRQEEARRHLLPVELGRAVQPFDGQRKNYTFFTLLVLARGGQQL